MTALLGYPFTETLNGRTVLHAMPLLLGVLCVLAIAYRYYSAFLATKVMVLDDSRPTPAHVHNDGQNYHPTNKWVLFGHHFAAISGAGPLIGPVLAIQYGYAPEFRSKFAQMVYGIESIPPIYSRIALVARADDCIVEAGCYVTAGARILLEDGRVLKAKELSGQKGILFRRNSQSGALEAVRRKTNWDGLNSQLHS